MKSVGVTLGVNLLSPCVCFSNTRVLLHFTHQVQGIPVKNHQKGVQSRVLFVFGICAEILFSHLSCLPIAFCAKIYLFIFFFNLMSVNMHPSSSFRSSCLKLTRLLHSRHMWAVFPYKCNLCFYNSLLVYSASENPSWGIKGDEDKGRQEMMQRQQRCSYCTSKRK